MRIAVPVLLFAALLLAGCRGDATLPNERNSWYQDGVMQLSDGKYKKAARSFETCLRYSPDSYQAHLQLGLLYEDQLHDLPLAIVHYKAYLESPPDDSSREKVTKLLARAEQAYYTELRGKYEEPPAATEPPAIVHGSTLLPPPSEPPAPAVSPPAEPVVVTPPAPPAPVAPSATTTYTVQKGDNLSVISRKVYGRSDRWPVIYQANRAQLRSPDDLHIGQKLTIPPAGDD